MPEYKIKLARELRQRQTEIEARLWRLLRGHRVEGLGFRRQRPIGRFIADFCCEERKRIIEIDGGYHEDPVQRELDKEREAHFTGCGYTVLRFRVDSVMNDIRTVLHRIAEAASALCVAESDSGDRHPSPAAGEGMGVGAK